MAMASVVSIINLMFIGLICAGVVLGVILLQVFLSKRDSPWPGLALPLVMFCFSLIPLFSLVFFLTDNAGISHTVLDVYRIELEYAGEFCEERAAEQEIIDYIRTHRMNEVNHLVDTGQIRFGGNPSIARIIFFVILFNMPTIVLLAIYMACRGKQRRTRALEIMSVQDL